MDTYLAIYNIYLLISGSFNEPFPGPSPRKTPKMSIDPGSSPKTPKTPSCSKKESLGFIYGDPISSLIAGRKPTKIEVIQLYMHLFDEVRKSVLFAAVILATFLIIQRLKDQSQTLQTQYVIFMR